MNSIVIWFFYRGTCMFYFYFYNNFHLAHDFLPNKTKNVTAPPLLTIAVAVMSSCHFLKTVRASGSCCSVIYVVVSLHIRLLL